MSLMAAGHIKPQVKSLELRQLSTVFALLMMALLAPGLQSQYLGPSPYLSFADSPWAALDSSAGYFHLEDFESAPALALGLSLAPGDFSVPMFSGADSVDGDDGDPTDGGCTSCNAWWTGGEVGVTISFDPDALGVFPTHVGLVCTDIVPGSTFIIEGIDAAGVSMGEFATEGLGDDNFGGGTAEDRFLGVINPAGVSSLVVRAAGSGTGGLEIDHVQYGAGLVEPGPVACVELTSGEVAVTVPEFISSGSLLSGADESDTSVLLVPEREAFVLQDTLIVDADSSGVYDDFADLSAGVVAAGSAVSSYMVHFDGVTDGVSLVDVEVTFGVPILGVIALDATLDATDSALAAPGVLYPQGLPTRGLEMQAQVDAFELLPDMRSIRFDLELTGQIDQFRVITASCDSDPWEDLGCALDGVAGPPQLTGSGVLAAGSQNALHLTSAAPQASAVLFVALTDGAAAFKGGVLKPVPPVLPPLVLTVGGTGELDLVFVWPSNVPGSTEFYFQFGIQDHEAEQGVALSNAVRATIP